MHLLKKIDATPPDTSPLQTYPSPFFSFRAPSRPKVKEPYILKIQLHPKVFSELHFSLTEMRNEEFCSKCESTFFFSAVFFSFLAESIVDDNGFAYHLFINLCT